MSIGQCPSDAVCFAKRPVVWFEACVKLLIDGTTGPNQPRSLSDNDVCALASIAGPLGPDVLLDMSVPV